MPFNVLSKYLAPVDSSTLFTAALGAGAAYAAKIYASGRKNVWEREWGGKLIMIVVSGERICIRWEPTNESPAEHEFPNHTGLR
jgi:hypothetical protein